MGALEVGSRADFAMLDDEPLADISAVCGVHRTYVHGRRATE